MLDFIEESFFTGLAGCVRFIEILFLYVCLPVIKCITGTIFFILVLPIIVYGAILKLCGLEKWVNRPL